MSYRMIRLLLIPAVMVAAVMASPLFGETLDDVLIRTYLTNPDLESNRAILRSNGESVNQALAGYLPDVFLRGQLASTTGQSSTRDLDQTSTSAALTLSQNLYQGGGTRALVNQAEALVQADRSTLIAAEQNIFLSAVSAYTAVWQDRSVLELAENNERRLIRQLQATRDRFEVGSVARTDVAQAEARLARATADIETAKADLAASVADFVAVVGEAPGSLVDPQLVDGLPLNLPAAQSISQANPNITAQIAAVDAQRHAVDVVFSSLLPRLDLNGSLDIESRSSGREDGFRSGAIALDLAIPLYQGGEFRSRVRQNRQLLDRERSNLMKVERDTRRDVDASWDRLIAAGAARKSFETEIMANETAFEGVSAEQDAGVRTVLDVLDAQQELFQSQVNFVRARREEVLASYQLQSSIGLLTVAGLGLEVEPYDANLYYEQNRVRLFGLDELAGKVPF